VRPATCHALQKAQTSHTKTPHNQQHVKKDESCNVLQTPDTKPPHNQQHVKKDESCNVLLLVFTTQIH
jgi:hypothetical protein